MKKIIIILGIICVSCKEENKDIFSLKYLKKKNEIYLCFFNNTNSDIVFLVPNTLDFGDSNFKKLSTQGGVEGSFPLTVYGIKAPDQSFKLYQKKLDSVYNNYLIEIGNNNFIGDEREGDGNSVIYLKERGRINIKYRFIVKQYAPYERYSSVFKQNFPPFNKVLKGNYQEGEYLRKFSKLNFGKAKFVAQPVIEDSLFLRLSEKDVSKQ